VSFALARGETLGIVGESGSGKTLTARAVVRLLPPGACVTAGRIVFDGVDVTAASGSVLRQVRGAGIGFVFQEPSAALSPVYTVGDQVREVLLAHGRFARDEIERRVAEVLADVGIPDAARRARDYPHQLSGGLRQRALLAIALAGRPRLLVADEPTTALDALRQADILDLLTDLRRQHGLSVLLVTHDLGVVARSTDRVAVMYAGRIVEEAQTARLLAAPRHPYTRGLLASLPGGAPGTRLATVAASARPATAPVPNPCGCDFAPCCPVRADRCWSQAPARDASGDHVVHCHLPWEEVTTASAALAGAGVPAG
jgi:oligopeptide/dipeptide ABC transporter ATP-binding protein